MNIKFRFIEISLFDVLINVFFFSVSGKSIPSVFPFGVLHKYQGESVYRSFNIPEFDDKCTTTAPLLN